MGIQTGTENNRVYIWRYPEEEFKEDCCNATHKSGFKKIKIWGSMQYGSLSNLILLSDNEKGQFTGGEYVKQIMDGELFKRWAEGMEELGDILIMEDGAGYHCGAATLRRDQYLKDGWQGWGPRIWSASSSDLNPLENLWHLLHTNIKKREPKSMKKDELIKAVQEEWAKMDMNMVNSLINSMPARMQAVIDANGGTTHY